MQIIPPTPFIVRLEEGDTGDSLKEVIYDNDLEYHDVSIVDGELHFTP